MKTFESPKIEILRFVVNDIVTVSNEDDLPFIPFSNLDMLEYAE